MQNRVTPFRLTLTKNPSLTITREVLLTSANLDLTKKITEAEDTQKKAALRMLTVQKAKPILLM